MRSIPTLLCAFVVATPVMVAAQVEKGGTGKGNTPDEVRQAEVRQAEVRQAEAKQPDGSMPADPAGESFVTADGTGKAAAAETNLLRFVAPVFSTKPHRLAPGQSGTLVAVLSLQGNAVMVPGMQVAVSYDQRQGDVTLGQWALLAAKPCTLYPKFKEQALYEKYAQIELPVTVAQGAKHGKHMVKLAMTIEITDGHSGEKLGVPRGEFQHEIVVGEPVPQPAPLATAGGSPASTPDSTPAAARAADRHVPAAGRDVAPAGGAKPLQAGGTSAAPEKADGSSHAPARAGAADDEPPAGGGSDTLLYAVLGLAGLALAGVVIAKVAKK